MSDTVNVGLSLNSLDSSPEYQEVTKVIVNLDDSNYIVAGDDTGGTLECSSPFATQEIANDLLNRVAYFKYRPFVANKVFIDPAAEIGDGISVGGINSSLFSMNNNFCTLFSSDCEAPTTKEIDHEYPYKAKADRKFERQMREVGSRILQTASSIATEVEEREKADNTIRSTITQTARNIVLEFAQENGLEDVTKYIRFEDGKIYLGIEGNPFQVIISNNRISFMDNTNETAYAANNQFRMPYGVVDNTLDLGGYQLDATDGIKFTWKGREQEAE